jgi:hypothetical protein
MNEIGLEPVTNPSQAQPTASGGLGAWSRSFVWSILYPLWVECRASGASAPSKEMSAENPLLLVDGTTWHFQPRYCLQWAACGVLSDSSYRERPALLFRYASHILA